LSFLLILILFTDNGWQIQWPY